MPDTDGYISNGGDGWEKTYWRNAEPEDVDPEGDAWVRVVAKHPLEGFKIDWNGAVGEGPAVDYSEPGEPLKSVGAEDPPADTTDPKNNSAQKAREYIKLLYVGISPRQQDVALMVLPSSFIKLINPKGITSIKGPGIDGVTQRGRLIIIQLDDAVSMSGNDYVLFEVAEGTFGITITVDTDREDGGNFFDCKAEEGDPCFDADGAIDQNALLQCLLRYDDIVAEHELEEIEEVPEAGGGCGNTERGKIDVPDLESYPLTEKVDEPVGNPGTDGSFTDPSTFTSPGSDFVADGIQPGDVVEINGERNTVDTVVDSNTVTFTAPVDAITQAGTNVEFNAVRPTPLTDETANQRDPCGNDDADRASVSYACPVQRSSSDDTDGTCTEDQEIDPRALCGDATDTDSEADTDTDTDTDNGGGDGDQSGVVVDVLVTNPRWPVVPARTGSAFNLAQAKLCGCQESAPAWLVSYKYFGSTLPLEPAPLKKLFDSQSLSNFPNTVRAVAAEGGDTCGSGLTFSVVIQAVSGPYVTVPDIYNAGDFAVFPHQPGTLTYKCSSCCSVQDVSTFLADRVHNFVAEDIVKVTDREFSVFGVANVTLGQTTIEIPTEFTDETFTLPTNILKDNVKLVTSVEFQDVNRVVVGEIPVEIVYPTSILEDVRSYPTSVEEQLRNYPTDVQQDTRVYPTDILETSKSYVTGIETRTINLPTNYLTDTFSLPATLGLESVSVPNGLETESRECVIDLSAVSVGGLPTGVTITTQTTPLTVCDAQGNATTINVVTGVSAVLTTGSKSLDLGTHTACSFDLPTALAYPLTPLSLVTGEGPIQSVDFPTSVEYGDFDVPDGPLSTVFAVPAGVLPGNFTVPTGIAIGQFNVPTNILSSSFTVPTEVQLTTQSVDDLSVVSESVPVKWYTEIVNTPTEIQSGNVTIKQPVAGGAVNQYTLLVEDASGTIELLKKTDCASGDHKVIDRGNELIKMTVPIESIGNVCATGNVSILVTDRETCDTVFFAVPKYLTHPSATASATRVPWYDGGGELSPSNPESFPNMQASPNGMATTNVVRVERTNAVRGVGMGRPL